MKKFYCFIMAISLLIGCESKIDCPVCKGEGKVLVYGEECRCAGCNGKGSLTNDEYKLYNYTDMRISFYLGEYDQLIQEIYETYKFTGKAKKKLEKIINYISFIKSGDIAYSFEKLKKDIKAM